MLGWGKSLQHFLIIEKEKHSDVEGYIIWCLFGKILVKNSLTIEFMIAAAIKSHLLENQFYRLIYYLREVREFLHSCLKVTHSLYWRQPVFVNMLYLKHRKLSTYKAKSHNSVISMIGFRYDYVVIVREILKFRKTLYCIQ